MQGDDAVADEWETQTREVLKHTDREIDEIRADAERRVAALAQRRRALEEALRAYHGTMGDLSSLKTEVAQARTGITKETEALDPEEIKGMSQRDILKLIASRNGNILHVARAKKLMKNANVFANPGHSDSAVYSVILRRPEEFVKIDKGVYRVADAPPKAKPIGRSRARTDSGVRLAIRTLKREDPSLTRDQVLETLVARGFPFGGKRPEWVVNMAWVAEGYSKKERQGEDSKV